MIPGAQEESNTSPQGWASHLSHLAPALSHRSAAVAEALQTAFLLLCAESLSYFLCGPDYFLGKTDFWSPPPPRECPQPSPSPDRSPNLTSPFSSLGAQATPAPLSHQSQERPLTMQWPQS